MKINVNAEILKITPEMASEWLQDKWGEQRLLRNTHVLKLASDMDAGRFKLSPDAILRVKGQLANGQHRLSALIQHGKPQSFLVMETNDEELYKVVDSGLKRAASDALIGIKYACQICAIAKWVQGYDLKTITQSTEGAAKAWKNKREKGHSLTPTQTEIINFCLDNKDILTESVAFVDVLYKKTRLLNVSIAGSLYVLASRHDGGKEKVKEFLTCVYLDGGQNSAADLRNRLISNKGSKSKIPNGYIFAITLKAYKSFANGSRPGSLKWAKDEALPEI